MLFWHILTKLKCYFDTCFAYTKSLTYGDMNFTNNCDETR